MREIKELRMKMKKINNIKEKKRKKTSFNIKEILKEMISFVSF